MKYLGILNLNVEPFSNSPSPDFFYDSFDQVDCLHKVEIALRLRRGLNVVLGDVGTGKTTICRMLLRQLKKDDVFVPHLLLDPDFKSPTELLRVLCKMLTGRMYDTDNDWELKEKVKHALYHYGVENTKIVALIIDEGQKISEPCLELLRELLNYETNEFKLLQIVIFAQPEFRFLIQKFPNVADRINELNAVGPLSLEDTRKMILHRLNTAKAGNEPPNLFTPGAFKEIHRLTGGYPRKILKLCHKCMLTLLTTDLPRVTASLVKKCSREILINHNPEKKKRRWWPVALAATVLLAGLAGYGAWKIGFFDTPTAGNLDTLANQTPVDAEPGPADGALEEPLDAEPRSPELPVFLTSASADSIAPEEGVSPAGEVPPAEVVDASGLEKESPAAPIPYPEVLGSLEMAPRGVLTDMIASVYGVYRVQYLDAVKAANPHVSDPDFVAPGERLTFPVITQAAAMDMDNSGYWLHVDRKDTLEEGYKALEAISPINENVRLFPYWTEQGGLLFALVLKQPFGTETEAVAALRALPGELRQRAKIVRGWENGTMVFANIEGWDQMHVQAE